MIYRRIVGVLLVAASIAGCASKAMLKSEAAPEPKPDEALMVFMRYSGFGGAIQASVFDVTGGEQKFIGIVSSGTKVGYYAPPGQRMFMVVSESADFMRATVEPGKTCYALVTPRIGMWKARFSLRPVRRAELSGSEFADWDSGTQFVVNTDQSRAWAAQNGADIAGKRAAYLPEWLAKPADAQAAQTLNAEDCR